MANRIMFAEHQHISLQLQQQRRRVRTLTLHRPQRRHEMKQRVSMALSALVVRRRIRQHLDEDTGGEVEAECEPGTDLLLLVCEEGAGRKTYICDNGRVNDA